MVKYVFWSVLNQHTNVALDESLSQYALGSTFWQALHNLAEMSHEWISSESSVETDITQRLRMYNETGINRIEIFVEKQGERFSVRCANSRSQIEAGSEREALAKYIAARSKTSAVNTGDVDSG